MPRNSIKSLSCTPKKSYDTWAKAEFGMRSLRRYRDERALHVYPCRHCGGFHVGHTVIRYELERDMEAVSMERLEVGQQKFEQAMAKKAGI